MKAEDFEAYKGKDLTVKTADERQVDLTLEKVEKLEAKGIENVEAARSKPFALIFSGPEKQRIMDQTVDIQLEDGKEVHKLFIKPLSQKEGKIIYESVFN